MIKITATKLRKNLFEYLDKASEGETIVIQRNNQDVARIVPIHQIDWRDKMSEAIDILAEDVELPAVSEGDYLALLNTGGYGSASSFNHCMRGKFSEYLLIDQHMNGSRLQFV